MAEHIAIAARNHVELLASHCVMQKKQLENLKSELQDLKVEYAVLDESHNESLRQVVDLTDDIALLKELADLRVEGNYSDCEVLVSNLSDDTEGYMIKSLFSQHGYVDRIEFHPDNNMAVVEYDDLQSVDKLFAYQKSLSEGLRLCGSTLKCVRLSC